MQNTSDNAESTAKPASHSSATQWQEQNENTPAQAAKQDPHHVPSLNRNAKNSQTRSTLITVLSANIFHVKY